MDLVSNSRPRVKNTRILRERIEKYISPIYFSDVNLFSKLYSHVKKIDTVLWYSAPGRISFEEATKECNEYKLINTKGQTFGPTWSTHWFRIDLDLSENVNWKGREVRFRWNSGTEAMVWWDHEPKQGLTGGDGQIRTDFILTDCCKGDEKFSFYIEMAANGMFGVGSNGFIQPTDLNKYFSINMLEVSVRNYDVYSIVRDLKIVIDMVENLPDDDSVAQHALQIGCDAVNICQNPNITSYAEAKAILDRFFISGNALGYSNRHCVHAIGHCHIDSAWLWPYAESKRKCGRSWSSVVSLMEKHPHFKFACSQAVQFDWVKMKYPTLFEKIKKYASMDRFLYTGGTWVEMDGNIPSGEAFVRQFLYGQKFFKKEFGSYCDVFWLPDTFGYSAQLPQIIRQSGMKYFLTQKLSWSLINKFPHNSFVWQGIDGSKCLTHFPPADTYESSVNVKDVLKTRDQNKEKGVVSDGMLLYGFGDGGGGPTEDMIENLNRMKDIEGFPTIQHSSPSDFYPMLEKASHLLHTWVGELYLELHQGTFTSQALIKKYNRTCEIALRNTEFYQVWAHLESKGNQTVATSSDTEIIWKKILLNQFHDVLPGTSINEVTKDAWKLYKEVISSIYVMDKTHFEVITGGSLFNDSKTNGLVFNTSAWNRRGLLLVDTDQQFPDIESQRIHSLNGKEYNSVMVNVPGMGVGTIQKSICYKSSPTIHQDQGVIEMKNDNLTAKFNSLGQLISCVLSCENRECIASNSKANQFCLFTDIPLYWDAWDVMPYNSETKQLLDGCSSIQIVDVGPLRVSFKFTIQISDSSNITQIVSLDAESKFIQFDTSVNWHENRKMLKVEFPFNIHTQHATYEIQYGHLQRPTHCNTSWDWAKHEVCGHKWVDMSEYGFGIALLNDCKYGFSAYGNTLQMSLLRSPKAPDDDADMGCHSFSYALMPYSGCFQSAGVIHQAYDFNNPLKFIQSNKTCNSTSLFEVSNKAVILDAIKICEDVDKQNCIIIRLYESFGSHVQNVKLKSHYELSEVFRVNVLENRSDIPVELVMGDKHTCTFSLKPFELLCLCLQMK